MMHASPRSPIWVDNTLSFSPQTVGLNFLVVAFLVFVEFLAAKSSFGGSRNRYPRLSCDLQLLIKFAKKADCSPLNFFWLKSEPPWVSSGVVLFLYAWGACWRPGSPTPGS